MNLAETRRVLAEAVAATDPRLQELLDYALEGGKGLRPTLVFLCARFGIYDALEAGRVAAAIELVHLASLVHDDILDGAAVRRNRPALYRAYGTVPAVLTGDYLFATAFGLLAKGKKAVLYTVTEAIRSMCSGEIGQLKGGLAGPEAYFTYIGQKTAALISAACRCGAILGRVKRNQQECLAQFGWHLGLAYQLVDDCLDLFGSPERMGKPCRQDLARGLLTLPVLRFLAVTPDAACWRERLARGLEAAEMEELVEAARGLGCDTYTAAVAADHVTRALTALDRLPVNPVQDELALLAARTLAPLEDPDCPAGYPGMTAAG
ncbi:polyprenyl synthetase family protein [Neomoorella thermoacetica]|uniref:polyprenyl synthetase family protein n=1 Tax=Neomoorella thermoacetica TaxID=1525 RepID=UPI0008FACA80|nr:polyprenyl synthetase family protein [Moorella thermoacetica]OIQ10479.1 heptaprenyl diphosphate synthase component 2 [Moorella thermoacetica]